MKTCFALTLISSSLLDSKSHKTTAFKLAEFSVLFDCLIATLPLYY